MDGHARILAALDRARPAAVIAATGRTPMAAGLYPFPLFEDGDLGHPSAFLRDVEGARAAAAVGPSVRGSTSTRNSAASPPSRSSPRKPGADPARGRVVVCAHIDSRYGTPGALDNAGGVCVLHGARRPAGRRDAGPRRRARSLQRGGRLRRARRDRLPRTTRRRARPHRARGQHRRGRPQGRRHRDLVLRLSGRASRAPPCRPRQRYPA